MGDPEPTLNTAREELYEIIRGDLAFEEKARKALELGRQYLDADSGHLTRIDIETDHWEAITSTDPPGQYPESRELDLETTYCRRVVETESPVSLHDAPDQGWDDDPAFETADLRSYQGVPLIIDGEPYGTVCFLAEESREPLRDDEILFTELVAQLLERELQREERETQLTRQTNLSNVLNRVLRHNLRNDMSVIRGFTQMMADELDENSYSETALDNIDKLIDLSEKARDLERIVTADFDRKSTEITGLVEDVAETVRQDYPDAAITVEDNDDIIAAVLPSLERALRELIENAAKHTGDTPTVTIAVSSVPNAVEIQIKDNGPGLASHEADVLKTGVRHR